MESLKKLILKDGEWEAAVLPQYAGNIMSLKCGGEQIMRCPENDEQLINNNIVYGSAFLLPPDRTLGGCFTFEGKEYHLPINDSKKISNLHGLMSDAEFEVLSCDEKSAVMCYENKGERYPFPFKAVITCTMNDGIHMEYSFENTGDGAMPILFGLHVNFNDLGYVKVPVDQEMFKNEETLIANPELNPLSELGQKIAEGMCPTGVALSNFFTAKGHTAKIGPYTYSVSDTFTHWVLWNALGKAGFVSVEPENGPVNGLKYKDVCKVLQKGETIKFYIDIRR